MSAGLFRLNLGHHALNRRPRCGRRIVRQNLEQCVGFQQRLEKVVGILDSRLLFQRREERVGHLGRRPHRPVWVREQRAHEVGVEFRRRVAVGIAVVEVPAPDAREGACLVAKELSDGRHLAFRPPHEVREDHAEILHRHQPGSEPRSFDRVLHVVDEMPDLMREGLERLSRVLEEMLVKFDLRVRPAAIHSAGAFQQPIDGGTTLDLFQEPDERRHVERFTGRPWRRRGRWWRRCRGRLLRGRTRCA